MESGSLRNPAAWLAPGIWNNSRYSVSAARSPWAVFIRTGKETELRQRQRSALARPLKPSP
jgi:hypothetical protein